MENKDNDGYNLKKFFLTRGINLKKIEKTLKILNESKIFLEKENKWTYKIGACCL